MDDSIKRAMKSFEKEECHKMWNGKRCEKIVRRSGNKKNHKMGKRS